MKHCCQIVRGVGTTVLAAMLAFGSFVAPANAAAKDPGVAIAKAAPEAFTALHGGVSRQGRHMVARSSHGLTAISQDPREPLVIGGSGGRKVRITLPFGGAAGAVNPGVRGAFAFEHGNGASTVPLIKNDGSVQITTVLDGPSAPKRVPYDIDVENAVSVTEVNGSIVYLDAAGHMIAAVAPAWAKDANGKSVSTHYEIEGFDLVQVIDHSPSDAYPIVADPWLGIDLFSSTWYGTYNGQLTVNMRKSAWGNAMHSPGAGNVIFATAGWDELRTKRPRVTEKPTLRQQYDCHNAGGYFNFAGDWNLEKARPDRDPRYTWVNGVAFHRCNWNSATLY